MQAGAIDLPLFPRWPSMWQHGPGEPPALEVAPPTGNATDCTDPGSSPQSEFRGGAPDGPRGRPGRAWSWLRAAARLHSDADMPPRSTQRPASCCPCFTARFLAQGPHCPELRPSAQRGDSLARGFFSDDPISMSVCVGFSQFLSYNLHWKWCTDIKVTHNSVYFFLISYI